MRLSSGLRRTCSGRICRGSGRLLWPGQVHRAREGHRGGNRLANDNEYGLSAAVFGRDVARALNVARKTDSGICHVNGPTVHDEAQMDFGGGKAGDRGVHRAAVDHGADGS
jgi:hypothetical protein